MFYWTRRTSGGSATLDGLGTVSKAEILRGIVTEKLATAAQEILAVVERTVSGYEEEIDRQRKQLELLQPRVELDRGVKPPELDGDELVVVRKEEDGHEQRQHQGVEGTGSLGLDLWLDDDAGDGAEEDAWLEAEPAPSSRQKQQDLQDPDYEMPARPFSQSDRRKPGRPRVTDALDHLVLRVCILEDSRINILSKSVFKKFPVQELQCPRGLRESDFLSLLRSTFPQLAADQPFGMFTSDRSRRLQPLKVKTLTPEEICRIIQSVGAGKSALYIRLKTGEGPGGSEGDATKDPPSSSESVLADESQMNTSQPEKRKRGRPRLSEPTPHCFKVSMLEDLQPDVVSADVVSVKSSGQELKCPSGVQEPDFLGLLRSTFPQVAADDTPLDVFKATRGRRLQKLGTRSLTPTEIYRTLKSTRARNSVLYIRVKTGDEEEDEELRLSQSNDADDSQSSDAAGMKTEDTTLELSSSAQDADGSSVVVLPGSSAPQQDKEAEDGDAAKEEAGDHNWKPDAELQSSKRRRPKYLFLEKRKTPCSVCGIRYKILGSLIKHAWRHVDEAQCVCGVCGERFQSAEELQEHLKTYQKTCECSYCGKSFLTITGLNNHITLHTGDRPFKCDVCSKTFPRMSNLSIHRWIHVAEKPHKCDLCTKTFGLKAQLRAHRKVHTGRDKFTCHICSKSFYDLRSLTRHKATHSGERRYGCEICGKRFKLPDTLKAHEKIHTVRDRPFLCEVCCKTFVSNCGLAAHLKTHSNVRPFVCSECGKGCISNGELKGHMLVHTDEAPHSCSDCGRRFKRKTHLNNHVRSHLGIKLFVCNVCGKACSRQEHLTVHMRTHSGERPYKCSLCEKAFTQGHCLKTHMKSHRQEQNPFMNLSTS